MVPPPDVFLSWLFNAASNEIDNIVNTFTFREVSPDDIAFILHLSDNKTLKLDPKKLTLDPSKPTKFVIHGWQASAFDESNGDLAQRYHNHGNYNVISVDWADHARKVYMHSASSTKDIGNILADFILELTRKEEKFLKNMHLLGVSLGGHVAGFAGQKVLQESGKKIGRITGLDVAAPLFEVPRKRSADSRLSPDDADFVDVIHTNAGFLGVSEAIGTADFYVENGGPLQPGCFNLVNIFDSSKLLESYIQLVGLVGCSHFKAVEYFQDSINGKKFEALSCPNSIEYHILACNSNKKVVMGEHVPRSAAGPYYLESDSPLPYSKLLESPFGIKINTPRFRLPFIN